jgi:hypothetical protein
MSLKITPNLQDFARVQALCGRLPDEASDEERVERYRLMQTAKLIRLWEHGLLPVEVMGELDRILRPPSEPAPQKLGAIYGLMTWLVSRLRRRAAAPNPS